MRSLVASVCPAIAIARASVKCFFQPGNLIESRQCFEMIAKSFTDVSVSVSVISFLHVKWKCAEITGIQANWIIAPMHIRIEAVRRNQMHFQRIFTDENFDQAYLIGMRRKNR